MKKSKLMTLTILAVIFTLMLTACSTEKPQVVEPANSGNLVDTPEVVEPTTVDITDLHGTVTVPVKPEKVVSLDSRTFETLADWGVKLAAAPKTVIPTTVAYKTDDTVQDIGSHAEPNLEIIAAVQPDLVIVGQRFAKYYDAVKELVPNAVVIDLNFDVDGENSGDQLVNGLKHSTEVLGKIFAKETEATKLNADFDAAIEGAKKAYDSSESIVSVIVSGGKIGYSAPQTGRVWGPMYQIFGWTSAFNVDGATSDHQGDDISVEAIAQSNPHWLLVLDRDAGASTEGATPAQEIIDNSPALTNVKAVVEKNIIYAPNDTYTNESIQTYLELFENLKNTFAK